MACDRGTSTAFATGSDMPQSGGHLIFKLSGSRLRLPFPRRVSCAGDDLRSVVWHVEQSVVWPLGVSLLREWVWADSSLKPSTQACLSYPSQRSRYPIVVSSKRSQLSIAAAHAAVTSSPPVYFWGLINSLGTCLFYIWKYLNTCLTLASFLLTYFNMFWVLFIPGKNTPFCHYFLFLGWQKNSILSVVK